MTLDEVARLMGFTDEQELHRMVAAADLSTPMKLRAFQAWKEFDGSKAGLSKLLPQEKPAAEEATRATPMEQAYHRHYVNVDVNVEKPTCPGCEYEKRMKS